MKVKRFVFPPIFALANYKNKNLDLIFHEYSNWNKSATTYIASQSQDYIPLVKHTYIRR